MYSVLIADDEIISRLGIANLIDWEAQGFTLVDTVVNGQEALDILREEPVDLVITDIKMPVMTGIELIKAATEEKHRAKFIVLSSYDDYEFVREALKLGALDYILKLDLDKVHMTSVLDKAKELIEESSMPVQGNEQIDKHTLSSARRDFLKQLLYGKVSFDQHIEKRLNTLQLRLFSEKFAALMFKVENLTNTPSDGGIRSVIEEVLEEYEHAYICDTGFDELCILYNMPHKGEQELYMYVQRLASRVSFIMKQYFNQKVVIYVSAIVSKLEDVPLTYLQVNQAYSYKSVVSDAKLVFFNEVMRNRSDRDFKSFEGFLQRFEKAIQRKEHQEINDIFDELFEYVETTKYIELGQISYFVFSLIYIMNQYLEGANGSGLWESEEERYDVLQGIKRKEDFLSFLNQLKEKLVEAGLEESDNYIIRNVKRHLKQHYREGVVLKEVADHFGLTNTYLSMLFKKETGETLKDYLTGLKIDTAKELLRETNLQVAEISKEVGYDNEHYFSRIFKQKTGVTPTGYRNKGIL